MESKPRLSCEQCRRRKTRCDKDTPCSACKISGLRCEVVQRARLPRGRSGKVRSKNAMLETRVARIEKLLEKAQADPNNQNSSHESSTVSQSVGQASNSNGSDFWSALSQEISGLRDTLDGSMDEGESPELELEPVNEGLATDFGALLFSHSLNDFHEPLYHLNAENRAKLLRLYGERVNCMYNVFHWPSTLKRIQKAEEPAASPRTLSHQALEYAIYLVTLCTISDDEAEKMSLNSRADLLQQYKDATEHALSKADVMRHPDMTGLQAFVIYLLALRACAHYSSSWMLVALAIRIGVALGFGSEDPRSISAFDLECRRRLWHCIAILDTQAALDRGTVPMLSSAYLGPPPLNIADCEMSSQLMPKTDSQGFTEMSYTMMMSEATICQKQLSEPSSAGTNGWQYKVQLAEAFAESMQRKYIQRHEEHAPFGTFIRIAAEEMSLGIQLLLRRPPYALKNAAPPSDTVDIMEVSTKLLEVHAQFQSAELSPWIWKRWVPWYSLGIVLAELCVRPNGEYAERSWAAAKQTYNRYARFLSNPDFGMPWRPILKLMSRVQRQRQNDARGSSTASPQTAISSSSAQSRGAEASNGEPILENVFVPENQNETVVYNTAIGDADMDWAFNFGPFSLFPDYCDLDITYSGFEPPNTAPLHSWDPLSNDTSSSTKEK